MSDKFVLTHETLHEDRTIETLERESSGAIVTFVGRVRANSRGHMVTLLEYEAYPEMAEAIFARIADEARQRYSIIDVVIHHRIGKLVPGDVSVVIGVSAAHRAEAFDACRYAIDRLKHTAPIWKKEHADDGATWIEDRP